MLQQYTMVQKKAGDEKAFTRHSPLTISLPDEAVFDRAQGATSRNLIVTNEIEKEGVTAWSYRDAKLSLPFASPSGYHKREITLGADMIGSHNRRVSNYERLEQTGY